MQPFKIIVDNRERNFDIMDTLEQSGVDIRFAQLPVGDYIISDRICVERKTISDLESSIINNRLFEQLERMSGSFEKPMLILEGDQSEHRLARNVIIGTMLKLYIDYGIQVIQSRDPEDTALILAKFAEREQTTDKKMPRILGLKKAYTTYQWQILILSSIPGIGPSLAHRLLAHFKSIKNVIHADVEDLKEVEKIGKKKADRIYEILNAEFIAENPKII